MKKIKENKIIIGIFIVILIIFIIILSLISSLYKKYEEEAIQIYDKVHELYYYGGDIEYEIEGNERKYIEEDENKYYEISNYKESIEKYFTKDKLKEVNKYLKIKEKNGKYYMKDIGRGISNYYETILKTKWAFGKKRTFIAMSKFCEIDHQVTYGDLCEGDHKYVIKKEFTIVKENDEWKVDKYTSVFEMNDKIK